MEVSVPQLNVFEVKEDGHTVPVGHVLVCDARGDIKHDDTALSVDVVAVSEPTELLLTGGVPYIKDNLAQVLYKRLPLVLDSPFLVLDFLFLFSLWFGVSD